MGVRETDIHAGYAEKLAQKAFLIIGIICGLALLFFLFSRLGLFDATRIKAFTEGAGPWAPLVLIALIAVTSVSLTIPSGPFIAVAGALFGPLLGAFYAWIGMLIGSSFAFFVARIFRDPIIKLLGEHAKVLIRFQQKYVGWVIFLTRLFPVFSYELVNYGSGLTSISYWRYLLATGLGTIISLLVISHLGSALLESGGGFIPFLVSAVMVVLLFAVPIAIDHYNPFGWKDKLLHPAGSARHKKR